MIKTFKISLECLRAGWFLLHGTGLGQGVKKELNEDEKNQEVWETDFCMEVRRAGMNVS